jgi:uncharacterized GH25 family protein
MKSTLQRITKKLSDTICKSVFPVLAILLLCSHDLYLKMETYFLQPNQEATVSLYNGTFEKSENIITRDRMLDASFVAQGKRVAINPEQWKDKDSTITQVTFNTGEAGTYVAGVSTKARNIELTAKKFNDYLLHDGVLDMLNDRKKNNLLNQDAVESYQKHVKAIYQVGEVKTNDWNTVLGYPIEFVPQANPYEKYSGESLKVQLLLDGKPLSNQLVYANCLPSNHSHEDHTHAHEEKEHSHEHDHKDGHGHAHEQQHDHDSKSATGHTHTSGQKLRTDAHGMVTVNLPEDGIYYLRTIHMENVTDSNELTHRSKWATLTFQVTHKHDETTHTHEAYEDKNEVPSWVFIISSILIIGLLFLVFRKKN